MKSPNVIEPVEIELDKTRHLLFNLRALFHAEREINRWRRADVKDFVSIDYLIISAAQKGLMAAGAFPLDLLITLIWAGLTHEDPELTIDQVCDLIGRSPLQRGKIVDATWEAYDRSVRKAGKEPANGEDQDSPLAQSPGS